KSLKSEVRSLNAQTSDFQLQTFNLLHAPDLVGVFLRRAVARELAHARHVENRHPPPVFGPRVGRAHPLLAVDVRAEVGTQLVVVVPRQRLDDGTEDAGMTAVERA